MEIFGKIGDVVSEKGRHAADKAKDTAEIMSLKSQLRTCEEVIKSNYLEIGRLFYEQYGDAADAPFEKQRTAIKNARSGAEQLQAKIDKIKGL